MDIIKTKKIGEVGLFLKSIKDNSEVLVSLKQIKNNSYKEILPYLTMQNCRQNWYRCGIPKKYKLINKLLYLLKENHKRAEDLQKQVNELINEKN